MPFLGCKPCLFSDGLNLCYGAHWLGSESWSMSTWIYLSLPPQCQTLHFSFHFNLTYSLSILYMNVIYWPPLPSLPNSKSSNSTLPLLCLYPKFICIIITETNNSTCAWVYQMGNPLGDTHLNCWFSPLSFGADKTLVIPQVGVVSFYRKVVWLNYVQVFWGNKVPQSSWVQHFWHFQKILTCSSPLGPPVLAIFLSPIPCNMSHWKKEVWIDVPLGISAPLLFSALNQ